MRPFGMGLVGLVIAALLGCAACEQNRKEPEPPASAPAAVEEKADQDCFSSCMNANQMRATAIEQIEADCRKSCEARPAPLSR